METSKIEIVIASYNENLRVVKMLQDAGLKVSLYNSWSCQASAWDVDEHGNTSNLRHPPCVKVPNLSREASQWLRHMIDRHGSYSEKTVFIQADLGWAVSRIDTEEAVAGFLKWIEECPDCRYMPVFRTRREVMALGDHEIKKVQDQFYSGGKSPQFGERGTNGAQFMASRDFLNRMPPTRYEELMEMCQKDPSFAVKAEFEWAQILDSEGAVYPF